MSEYAYEYVDAYAGYGYDYDAYEPEAEPWTPAEAKASQTDLDLSAWRPQELLTFSDQEALRELERLVERQSGARRSSLNRYLEKLGSEAIDFASLFEDMTGIEVLALADDVTGAAAFLATLRLIEQGGLGMEEAVDVLRRSLRSPSEEWTEGVRQITIGALDGWGEEPYSSADEPAAWISHVSSSKGTLGAMMDVASRSINGVGKTVRNITTQFAGLQWRTMVAGVAMD